MDDGDERRAAASDRAAAQHGRGQRLAAALRANLAKRKEQGRARARRGEETARAAAGESAVPPEEWAAQGGDPGTPSHDSAEIIAE